MVFGNGQHQCSVPKAADLYITFHAVSLPWKYAEKTQLKRIQKNTEVCSRGTRET